MSQRLRIGWSGLLLAALACCTGCGTGYNGPPTVPVKGRVVFSDGSDVKLLHDRQCAVVFKSPEEPGISAFGEIQPDGSFTLSSVKDRTSQEGAIVGTHQVRLNLDDSMEQFVSPSFGKFETSGLTVKVPSDDEIVLYVRR